MAKPLDDSQLLRLASDPRTRLFPPLRGATVFGPLVALAGLIPFLAVVFGPELGDEAAGWALRALDLTSATSLQEWLEPGIKGLGNGYVHQPPLSSWLLALVIRVLGPDNLGAWRGLSMLLVCCSIWAMYLLGRRLGGASFGLIVALILCGHPVMLRLATGTSPAALGILLIVFAVWGFLGHLEGPAQLVSMRMLAGSVAWGLALLAVGPVAVVLFIPMLVQAWLLHEGRFQDTTTHSAKSRLWQLWLGMRTLTVFVVTALSFSGWWQLMMLTNHGGEFWLSWWTGQVAMNFPAVTPHSCWRQWLAQNSFLCGWLVIGLMNVVGELRHPASEISRRRCQFVLVWWLTALAMRITFDLPGMRCSALIDAWDVLLLLPTTLLVAWGVKSTVMRQTQQTVEALLITSTLGLCVWRWLASPWWGIAAFLIGTAAVALLPAIATRVRRGARRWTERDWKLLMRLAFVAIFAGHLLAGITELPPPSSESKSLSDLRKRIAPVTDIPRVTLMTMSGAVPESLLFVLRSHWPMAQFVLAGSRDGKSVRENAGSAAENEIVIDWSRHEVRIANEIPVDRQATAIGDPLRFRDRRLMIYRVSPRQR